MDGSFAHIEFEDVNCMLCGSQVAVLAGSETSHGAIFHYKLCAQCGLKYMSPRPSARWYVAHYANHFWEFKQANRSWQDSERRWRLRDLFKRSSSGRQRHQASRLKHLIPQIEEFCTLDSKSRLLDIGCAYGAIGNGLKRHFGCEVWGVEPNASAREVASRQNGIRILCNSAEELADIDSTKHQFDIILMSNVLENILEPKAILHQCRQLLRDCGHLMVHMPNFYYYDAMNPYHPYVYSPETLTKLLQVCGFDVVGTIARDALETGQAPDRKFVKTDMFVTAFATKGVWADPGAFGVDTSAILRRQVASLQAQAAAK